MRYDILNRLDPKLKKSMTYDNGIEMASHQEISKKQVWKFTLLTPIHHGKEELTKTLIDLLEGIS